MEIVKKCMDSIAKNALKYTMLCVFVIGMFCKPMYAFEDYPYFESNTIYDFLAMAVVLLFILLVFRYRSWIQRKMKWWHFVVVYMAIGLLFVIFVPLKPFSDMEHVYQAALRFSEFEWESVMDDSYWNIFPGNVYLSVFWGILLIPLPKVLLSFKILNILFAYGIITLTAQICKEYGFKYYNIIQLYLVTFLPLLLYTNHIYYDLPFVFLSTLALYLNVKKKNIIYIGFILGTAIYLRDNGWIFLAAIVIDYIFVIFQYKTNIFKKTISLAFLIIICLSVCYCGKFIVKNLFIKDEYPSYPSANQFYIGLNEEEFGFMDGDFSYERTMGDVVKRVQEYGPFRTMKILIKKTVWLWMQGTYQAQRYAFGVDCDFPEEKFQYVTYAEKYLMKDSQKTRKFINAFMRGQYMVLFTGMIFFLWKENDISLYRIYYYVLMATLLIMLVYELKSRYVFHCLPIMSIMCCYSLQWVDERIKGQNI